MNFDTALIQLCNGERQASAKPLLKVANSSYSFINIEINIEIKKPGTPEFDVPG